MSNKKKVNISYACSRQWDSFKKLNNHTGFCESCHKKVTDYSVLNQQSCESQCGKFNLKEVNSFQRKFELNQLKKPIVSLTILLGLTAIPMKSINAGTLKENISVVKNDQSDKIKISGKLINKKTKEPLSFGTIEFYHFSEQIKIAPTDFNGNFSTELDLSNYKIENISVSFFGSSGSGNSQSDTIPLKIGESEDLVLEMSIQFDEKYNTSTEFFITGEISDEDYERLRKEYKNFKESRCQ